MLVFAFETCWKHNGPTPSPNSQSLYALCISVLSMGGSRGGGGPPPLPTVAIVDLNRLFCHLFYEFWKTVVKQRMSHCWKFKSILSTLLLYFFPGNAVWFYVCCIYSCVLQARIVHVSKQPGCVAQSVTCLATDASLTADPGVASSIPALSHIFVEIDHEIISTVILLPSAESFKKGCCQLQAKVWFYSHYSVIFLMPESYWAA